ncbi:DUF1801 domain-containing protein [Silvimonas sp.]|uniref:DUF1801 domain-containing protein n=1 Tax=Silvimonas sp. TaxID=2650811 RepID=UPI00284DCF60|nr:DUF1801 domain-containing protein [Silvimonas sp.]MDR3427436.1 DUF1801 domain-containing protein [Silvimonas sp.]
MHPFADPMVEAVFSGYPEPARSKLLFLRQLIFEVAAATPGVGPLQETLKWGEPAYLTSVSGSGSTVRMACKAKTPDQYALYFICHTGLVATFRTLFPDALRFEGDRAIVFGLDNEVPVDAVALCLKMALSYHRKKSG